MYFPAYICFLFNQVSCGPKRMPPHLRFTHSTSHSHPCGTYCALILQRDNAIFSWKDGWLLLNFFNCLSKQCQDPGCATMHLSCFLLRSLDSTPQCRLPVYVALWYCYRTTCNGLNPWVFGKTLESIPTDSLIVLSHSNPLAGIQHSDDNPLCWLSACLHGLGFPNANSPCSSGSL